MTEEEALLKLIEQFNETGEIDVDEFADVVLLHRLKFNNVYVHGGGGLTDFGPMDSYSVDTVFDYVTTTIKAIKPNGFTRPIARRSSRNKPHIQTNPEDTTTTLPF